MSVMELYELLEPQRVNLNVADMMVQLCLVMNFDDKQCMVCDMNRL